MPIPIRSSDSSISSACWFVNAKIYPFSRQPPLQLHGLRLCSGPVDWIHLRNEAQPCRRFKVEFQPPAILGVEREINVVAQVRFKRALGQFQVLSCFVTNYANMR